MSFFKSVLVGVFAGLAAVVVWVLVKAGLSLNLGVGAGSIGFVISEVEILVAAIAGYCAGYFWYRRSKRSRT
jgi:hypothetical protein